MRRVLEHLHQVRALRWRDALPGAKAGAGVLAVFLSSASLATAQAPRLLLLDAALAGSDIVCVGEHGAILRSTDSGKSWVAADSPATATLTGVSFAPDSLHGWAVGHDALVLATSDGGRSWLKQWQGQSLEASLLDVCSLDSQRVVAVGAYGLCLITKDGGKTWSQRKVLDEDMHLNRITRGPTGTLYIAGERGTLLRSRDDGATWARIDSPYDGSFYGILPLGPRQLLAYGLRGRVFRSSDDGETWNATPIDQPMLLATAVRTRSGAILLAGQSRALYASSDGVMPFTPWHTEFTDAVAELLEAPDGTLLAFGEAGIKSLPIPEHPGQTQ
jgi:photosystem II stability/assembly factor-like uncharacterized protein